MQQSFPAALVTLSLALVACGGRGDRATSRADSTDLSESPAAGTGATATTMRVIIGGGPHAGTYDVKSSEVTCTYGLAGKGAWGNAYSATGKKPSEVSSVQLIVPDTKDAADGTERFTMTVGFGDLASESGYSEHKINTSNRSGSGTVTVDDRGKSGKVTFKGKTADGMPLEGTIDCHQVIRTG